MHILSIVCIVIFTLQTEVDGSFFTETEDVERLKKFYGDNILNTCSKNVDITKCVANALKIIRAYSDDDEDNDEVSCTRAVKNRSEKTEISGENEITDYEKCSAEIKSNFYEDEYDYFEKLEKSEDYTYYDGPYAEYFNESCFKELLALNYSIRDSVSQYNPAEFKRVCRHFLEVRKFCNKKTFTYDNKVPEFVERLYFSYCNNEQAWIALGLINKPQTHLILAAYTFAISLVGLIIVWLYFTDR